MSGPWEKYGAAPAAQAEGPWTKFQPAAQELPVSAPANVSGLNVGLAAGMTGNFSDEIFAAGMAPIEAGIAAFKGDDAGKGLGERLSAGYDRALVKNREYERQGRQDSPVSSTVGDVVGGLMTGGALAKGGVTLLNAAKPTVASMAGRGAAEGAAYGAVYGAGAGEDTADRLKGAGYGAVGGAVVGGGVGAVAGKVASRAGEKAVASNDDLRSMASAAYKQADDAGVIFTPEGVRRVATDIVSDLTEAGFHPQLQPRIATVLGELNRIGENNVTLKGMETLRKIANSARMSQDPSEQMLGRKLIDRLDDFVAGAGPSEILTGNQAQGAGALQEARGLWSAVRKSEMLDDALGRADLRASSTGSGGNLDNATRQNVRAILDNPRKRAGFNEEEIAALEAIVKGTASQNALRLLGRMAPQAGGLMGVMNAGAAGASGGASLPLTAAAAGAKVVADRMTLRSADLASTIIRNLGKSPEAANLTPGQLKLIEAAIKAGALESPRAMELYSPSESIPQFQ